MSTRCPGGAGGDPTPAEGQEARPASADPAPDLPGVRRDALGVPHLRAADELALAELQGRVTARDRAWQVETDRWRAEGRLAEHVGPSGLEWDLFARRARLADTARRAWDALPDDDRAWVGAYVRGVRAELPAARRRAPEFAALRSARSGTVGGGAVHAGTVGGGDHEAGTTADADPWPDWAPLGIWLVAHSLFSAFPHALWRQHVAATLGPVHGDAVVDLFDADGGPGAGSTAWAVTGARTASGAPLLVGDPHRLLELPGPYQQVGLARPGSDVVGLVIPGVPGVQHFGQGRRAAWVVTNAVAHDVAVHREVLRRVPGPEAPRGEQPQADPADRPQADGPGARADRDTVGVEALGPDGWRRAHAHREHVRVRGGADVVVEVVETERGVVVSGGAPDDGPGVAWSVATPARLRADVGLGALRRLQSAGSAADVADAFATWVTPVDRVLAADVDGQVLSLTAGLVPAGDRASRRLPRDARCAAPRTGATAGGGTRTEAETAPLAGSATTLPDDDLRRPPRAVTVRDVAVDGNERPRDPAVDLGWSYARADRACRVAELLAGRDGVTAVDQDALLGDTASASADALLALLDVPDRPDVLDRPDVPDRPDLLAGLSPAAVDLARTLRAWDRRADASSTAAAAFARWRSALVARVAAHPALAGLHADHGHPAVFAPWLSVTARVADALPVLLGPRGTALLGLDPGQEARAALEDAATSDRARTWGDAHRLLSLHVLDDPAGPDAGTGAWAAPPVPLSGDTDCVRSTTSLPGTTDLCARASVARVVWDLSDRGLSRWSVPFGASGLPDDPHALDQLLGWADARTTPVGDPWRGVPWPDAPSVEEAP